MSGRAPKTVKNLHGLLSALLRDAAQEEYAETNAAERTRLLRRDELGQHEMVFLTPQEFELLRTAAAPDVRDLLTVAYGTGLRWSELSALQVRHVDLLAARPTVKVEQAWKRRPDSTFTLGAPKTRKSRRTLVLGPELIEALIPYVASRASEDFVFTARDCAAWRHGNFYNRRWRPAVASAQAAGLGKAPRIHDLRHSHVVALISAGAPSPRSWPGWATSRSRPRSTPTDIYCPSSTTTCSTRSVPHSGRASRVQTSAASEHAHAQTSAEDFDGPLRRATLREHADDHSRQKQLLVERSKPWQPSVVNSSR